MQDKSFLFLLYSLISYQVSLIRFDGAPARRVTYSIPYAYILFHPRHVPELSPEI